MCTNGISSRCSQLLANVAGISEKVADEPDPVAPAIPDDVPPSFCASAGVGDLIHAVWATEYFTAMLHAKVPNTEMHIYASGSHGGGLTHMNGIPFGTWTARCETNYGNMFICLFAAMLYNRCTWTSFS